MKSVFLAVLLTLSSMFCWSDSDSVSKLIKLLNPIESMSGNFSQIQRGSEGELLSQSSGVFRVARPGKLRWETKEPFTQLLVSDGKKLWLYDADLEQVTVSKVDDQLNQTPAVIFSGDLAAINQQFLVSSVGNGQFSLLPKAEEGYFQRLDLEFDSGQLSSMIILDGFGQQTIFTFTEVNTNEVITADVFVFIPPQGVDVLIHD